MQKHSKHNKTIINGQLYSTKDKYLQVKSSYSPHHQAMLAALRVVLDLLQKPIPLQEEESLNQASNYKHRLAINSNKSDVCDLTAGTHPKEDGQEV